MQEPGCSWVKDSLAQVIALIPNVGRQKWNEVHHNRSEFYPYKMLVFAKNYSKWYSPDCIICPVSQEACTLLMTLCPFFPGICLYVYVCICMWIWYLILQILQIALAALLGKYIINSFPSLVTDLANHWQKHSFYKAHKSSWSSKMQLMSWRRSICTCEWEYLTRCFMQHFQTPGATLFLPLHKPSVDREGLWVSFSFVLLQLPVYCWTGKRPEISWSLAFTVESKLQQTAPRAGRLVWRALSRDDWAVFLRGKPPWRR